VRNAVVATQKYRATMPTAKVTPVASENAKSARKEMKAHNISSARLVRPIRRLDIEPVLTKRQILVDGLSAATQSSPFDQRIQNTVTHTNVPKPAASMRRKPQEDSANRRMLV
jgi:hypothetical protein